MIVDRRLIRVLVGNGFAAAPRFMWVTVVLTLVTALTAAAYPIGFKLFIDGVVQDDTPNLVLGCVLTAGLVALYWAAASLEANIGFGLTERVALYVTTRICRLVNAVRGIEHFERPEYLGQLDLILANRGLLGGAPRQTMTALQALLRATVMIALLVTVSPALLVLPALVAAPSYGQRVFARIRLRADERVVEERRLANELFTLGTTAASAKEFRVFGLGPALARRHRMLSSKSSSTVIRAAVVGAAAVAAGWIIFIIGFVGAIVLLVDDARSGAISAGQVVMAVVITTQVRLALASATTAFGHLLTTAKTVRRLFWLEDYAVRVTTGRAPTPDRIGVGVRLDGVSFRYPGASADVIRNVSVALPAGSTVALVGDNGAGKSTLVKLLTGMYEPTSGEITVDGLSIGDIARSAWQERISAAYQDFAKLELVASECVGVGDLERSTDLAAVSVALDRAGASDVVADLDEGLATPLGRSMASGRDLSGGQWQKLALSRSMMRDAPLLLVLDEPTASLDAESEHLLFQRYVQAARRTRQIAGTVTLLVSHRFTTVRDADLILVLDDGQLLEHGNHQELMSRGGMYAELYDLQAQGYR